MPKNLFVDPAVVRAPGKVTFNEIPVNQYNKTIKEELESVNPFACPPDERICPKVRSC